VGAHAVYYYLLNKILTNKTSKYYILLLICKMSDYILVGKMSFSLILKIAFLLKKAFSVLGCLGLAGALLVMIIIIIFYYLCAWWRDGQPPSTTGYAAYS
jgi:hypothetical protein